MADPTVVTITIAENPLPDGPDYTITVSSVPDLELPPDGSLPDPSTVPLPLLVATEMVAHITGMAAETTMMNIARGEDN